MRVLGYVLLGLGSFFLGFFIGHQEDMTSHLIDREVWVALGLVAIFGAIIYRFQEEGDHQVYKTTLFPLVWVGGTLIGFSFGPEDPGKVQDLVVFLGLTMLFVPVTALLSIILAGIKEAILSIERVK